MKKRFYLSVTSRQETHKIEINNIKIKSYQFSNDKFDSSIIKKLEEAEYILVSIPPIGGKDIVARYLDRNQKITIVNGLLIYQRPVYGDHKGDWVNENSTTKPTSVNGISRLEAEETWKSLSKKTIIHYKFGISRHIFKSVKYFERLRAISKYYKKNHFFSRIHVEDIANILFKSLSNFKNNEIYNICDDKPASQSEVAAYGARLLKLEKPNPIKLEEVSRNVKLFIKTRKK